MGSRTPHGPARGREGQWIAWIRRVEGRSSSPRFPITLGDDAAVWTPRRGHSVVLTVDVQVDGIHFRRSWLRPREIGRRAVAACLSDLAAMAAEPACVLVSIVVGKESDEAAFRELYRAISQAARRQGAPVAGGNISSGPFSITITGIGEGKSSELVHRDGARPGDDIWVTGSPGLARLGLQFLDGPQDADSGSGRPPAPPLRRALRAYRRPTPRIREALEIARRWKPIAMIDLSDGLSTDLGHILEESSRAYGRALGAVLEEDEIGRLPGLKPAAQALGADPVTTCLSGGDDYELAFTLPSRRKRPPLSFTRGRGRVPLTRVGSIVETPGLWLREAGGELRRVVRSGWEHH